MEEFYMVIEHQILDNGSHASLPIAVETDINVAESRYYSILASAAISTIPYHGAWVIRSDGFEHLHRVYDRRQNEEPVMEG